MGVLGRTSAPGGAGVRAVHREGGADLVLDGSEQALTDTVLTESGLDRSSGAPETFNFQNSGGGFLTLQVDGIDVVTAVTDHDTLGNLSCAANENAKFISGAWTCNPASRASGPLPSSRARTRSGDGSVCL